MVVDAFWFASAVFVGFEVWTGCFDEHFDALSALVAAERWRRHRFTSWTFIPSRSDMYFLITWSHPAMKLSSTTSPQAGQFCGFLLVIAVAVVACLRFAFGVVEELVFCASPSLDFYGLSVGGEH